MLESILLGGGFAFAASIQPGPLQAFLLARAASDGWRRTLPAAVAPILTDGPIALLVLLVVGTLPPGAQGVLRAAGGVLLIVLAVLAYRAARTSPGKDPVEPGSAPRTLAQAVIVNLLNPNPYLGWALVLGPAAVAAWRRSPAEAVVLVASFYGTMAAGLAGFIVLAGTARTLGPRVQRALVLASVAVLAALGVVQLAVAGSAALRGAGLPAGTR